MPYQDIEEEPRTTVRTPGVAERWVRKVLVEDWTLKLIAIAVTVVLWLAVTGQNKPVMQRTMVQLTFQHPDGMEISNEPPANVEVLLKGSATKLDQVGSRLMAIVDVSDQKAGERVIRLSQDRVQMSVPAGVSIESFRPATVTIRLDPVVESAASVDVKFEGKVPEGYEVSGVTAMPDTVKLRGPAEHVRNFQKVTTETVSLDGHRESFTLSNVAIGMPDPKIEVVDGSIQVRIDVVEKKRTDLHWRPPTDATPFVALLNSLTYRQ